MFLQKIQKQHAHILSNIVMLFIAILFGSCSALEPSQTRRTVFKILDSVDYPFQEILNGDVFKSLEEFLTEEALLKLEDWRESVPILENLIEYECVGCSNTVGSLKPVYKVEKGKFVHFGFQTEIGVENWVFKKNGAFASRFYMFQGESQEQILKTLKGVERDYIVEGLYPTATEPKSIYLEHIKYHNNTVADNTWYQPIYPTKIRYRIDLSKKRPVLRFKIDGGLYSHQKTDENGKIQIINFVEPLIYPNAVGINEPMSYSSFTHAFYANATFFSFELEEKAKVSIHIESKIPDKEFKFSAFKNDGFYTMEEYLKKEGMLLDRYENILGKGGYLVRVLHENSDYTEKPLYTVYVDKENVD